MRVGDLFREWDDDNNGKVSKDEFTRGLKELGFEASDETIHEVFDTWDPDGSGVLELREVEKQLRRGSSIVLDAKLQAGGAGAIETQRGGKHALRKEKKDAFARDAKLMQGVDIDETSDKSVAEQVWLPAASVSRSRSCVTSSPARHVHVT